MSQVGTNKVSTARKYRIKLNYMLNLSDYTGTSNVLSIYSIMPLVRVDMYFIGWVYI